MGDRQGIAKSLNNLGSVADYQGDYTAARRLCEESLAILRESGDRKSIAEALGCFAALAAVQGQAERAASLWGTAEALREETGSPIPANERETHDRQVASARQAAGEEAFSAAWAEGRMMPLEQAIELALQEPCATF